MVGDDQPHPGQATLFPSAQEPAPKHLVLRVTNIDTEHLTTAVGGDTGRHDHGHRGDLASATDMQIGGVKEHIREGGVAQRPAAECLDLLVQAGADPAHLRLRDARFHAERG